MTKSDESIVNLLNHSTAGKKMLARDQAQCNLLASQGFSSIEELTCLIQKTETEIDSIQTAKGQPELGKSNQPVVEKSR